MRKYYIVSPEYRDIVNGYKVLWALAHSLCKKGYDATIVLYDDAEQKFYNGKPNSPYGVNTTNIENIDKENGIVVYFEGIDGNPLEVKTVVRYMLNSQNLFYEASYGDDDIIFTFVPAFATEKTPVENVLYTPTTEDFFIDTKQRRTKKLVYFGKSSQLGWNSYLIARTKDLWHDAEVITRLPERYPATRKELAKLFNEGDILYCYDDTTAISMEAVLCGCPVVIMTERISKEEVEKRMLFKEGIGLGIEEEEYARETAHLAYGVHQEIIKQSEQQLNNFIQVTQNAVL